MNDVALDDARETRTLFSAAARNVLVTLVGQAVSVGLSLLTTLWLIQHLGPARYGIYLVVLTIITLLDLTIEASLFEMAVREIAKSKDRAPEWLGAVTWIRATSGALLSAALLLGPLVLPLHPEASAAVWVGAGICLVNGFRTPLTYFRARLLMHWEFGLWTLVRALELGLVILITRHEGSLALLLGAKAVTAVLFVAAVWSVLHYRFRLPVHSGRSLVRPLLLLSAPVTLTLLLMMVQLRGDILMMSWRLGATAAGAFGAVAQIPEFVIVANGVLYATAAPLLAQLLGKNDTRQFQLVFQRLFDGLVLILPGMAVVCCFLAEALVHLGFGSSYVGVVPQFRILVWVGAVIPIAGLMGVTAVTLNLQSQQVKIELANAGIYLLGNLLLLGLFGSLASAWIRLVVVLIGPTWTYLLIRTYSTYRLSMQSLFVAAAATGLAAVVMAATGSLPPLIGAVAGGTSYALLVVAGIYVMGASRGGKLKSAPAPDHAPGGEKDDFQIE